jgi:hypothetical protein
VLVAFDHVTNHAANIRSTGNLEVLELTLVPIFKEYESVYTTFIPSHKPEDVKQAADYFKLRKFASEIIDRY